MTNSTTPNKPLCAGAWAVPPTPLMLDNGNTHHTCNNCGEPCDAPELATPTTRQEATGIKFGKQADLAAYISDPETIKRAAEGSMQKRQDLLDKQELREKAFRTLVERTLLLETGDEPIASLQHDFAHEALTYGAAANIMADTVKAEVNKALDKLEEYKENEYIGTGYV